MKKISIYIPLLMLASCAAEEALDLNSPADYDSPKIVVCGASTAPDATRADYFLPEEPSHLGICNADKIKIIAFKGTTIGGVGGTMTAGAMTLTHQDEIDLPHNLNYRDKWAKHLINLTLDGTLANWFAFPSIAYSSNDGDKFTIEHASYADIKLKIPYNDTKSYIYIPELYFGRLLPTNTDYKFNNTLDSDKSHEAEGMKYKYSDKTVGHTESENSQLEGKLYRIVSQLNINISEVSPNVEKIEMYLSNVPTQIGLYAKHRTELGKEGTDRGYFYPIVEAAGDSQHSMKETLVCTVENNDSTEWTAKLSTFILPSDRGRTVTLKAYIKTVDEEKKEVTIDDNDENTEASTEENNKTKFKIIERTRLLRASQDYNLSETTSKVYFSDTQLPVYKAATNEFISYPNIRVNVSGKLSDIFSEESESNIEIEICPNYDGKHEISI